jgi:hypothetical protein
MYFENHMKCLNIFYEQNPQFLNARLWYKCALKGYEISKSRNKSSLFKNLNSQIVVCVNPLEVFHPSRNWFLDSNPV